MEKKKVRVFAAYQIGTGIHAKMFGDVEMNKFEVNFATTSEMVREIEGILEERHAEEMKKRRTHRNLNTRIEKVARIGIDQLAETLERRLAEEEGQKPIIIIHHFQIISSF